MTRMEVLHLDNLQHEATVRSHSVILDEPKEVGGDDKGMSPYEALLSAPRRLYRHDVAALR